METRRLLLAFVLSLAVIAHLVHLFPPAKPEPPEAARRPRPSRPPPARAPGAPGAGAPPRSGPAHGDGGRRRAPARRSRRRPRSRITLRSGAGPWRYSPTAARSSSRMMAPEKSDPKSGALELVRQRTGLEYPYSSPPDGLPAEPSEPGAVQGRAGGGRPLGYFSLQRSRSESPRRPSGSTTGGCSVADVRVPGRADWGVAGAGPACAIPRPRR